MIAVPATAWIRKLIHWEDRWVWQGALREYPDHVMGIFFGWERLRRNPELRNVLICMSRLSKTAP